MDKKRYAQLLVERLPRIILSNHEYTRIVTDVEGLMKRGAQLNSEERELTRLMVILIEDYENKRFVNEATESNPFEVLVHLMDAHGHTAKDLWDVIGDKGTVSKILAGQRQISKSQARRLAEFYKVSPSVFIN